MVTHTPSWDNVKRIFPGVMTAMASNQERGEHAWAKTTWEKCVCGQGIDFHARKLAWRVKETITGEERKTGEACFKMNKIKQNVL